MTAPDAPERSTTRWRLAGIALLGIRGGCRHLYRGPAARARLYLQPVRHDPVLPKSLLATIVLGLAVIQVLLAL